MFFKDFFDFCDFFKIFEIFFEIRCEGWGTPYIDYIRGCADCMGGYFFPVKFCTKGCILESLHMGLVHRIDQKSSQNGQESSSNIIVLIGFLNSPQRLSKTVTNKPFHGVTYRRQQ